MFLKEKEFYFFFFNIFLVFPYFFKKIYYTYNNILLFLINNNTLLSFFYYLKKNYNFFLNISLLDLWCVDYFTNKKRFELNYNFLIYNLNIRFFLKIYLKEFENIISISNIFFSSNWLEREVFDFFGINFLNHLNLRRILNDYGFLGYPLRKDFPISGYFSIKYKNNIKKILNENLFLNQQFRKTYINVWVYSNLINYNYDI